MYIILDIDSTLLFADFSNDVAKYLATKEEYKDRLFKIKVEGQTMNVLKRKGLDEFLRWAEDHHTIIIWSAGVDSYVKAIVNALDIKCIDIMSRECCIPILDKFGKEPILRKPLKVIYDKYRGSRLHINKHNTVMIDDRKDVMKEDAYNHIHIPPFEVTEDAIVKNDTDLKVLIDIIGHR